MVEFWPFALVGALAVAAAVLMLLSENAIHSALFLIVTMACIAFLFLLLNAPFLAMIQITVYAGAIMVLFLFVIMLLGAERVVAADPGEGKRRMRWFTPAAIILTISLLFAVGTPLLVGQSALVMPAGQPSVRVLNVAADAETVDVYTGETLIASGLHYGETSPFVVVPAGEHEITWVSPDTTGTTTFTLAPDTVQMIVAYGTGEQPTLALVPDDLSSVPERSTRITIFHANPEAPSISLVDFGVSLTEDDSRVLVENVAPGELSSSIIEPEGTVNWSVVDANNYGNVQYEMPNYTLSRDHSDLIVFAGTRIFDGSLRPVAVPVVTRAEPSFGSPQAIGYELFTTFMLPMQLLAMLLLAAMVGVIVLTHREPDKARRVTGRRRVSRPLANVVAAQVGTDVTETVGE